MASEEEEQQPSQATTPDENMAEVAATADGGASANPTGPTQAADDIATMENDQSTRDTGSKQEQVRMNHHLSSRYSAVLRLKSSL